ncbi:hypothetical protein CH256_17465 [Rhodococcus sp. 05-2254-6]|uniref:hypothetical protein n=1 Tax=Rhodococcus sp. 05-2254-6 TaxID=2022489 RepID=UPI000B9AB415|nr:hypothetical protein [Rhodococcus sp. 05-2254-6]OZE26578.1 hypothetical protein CH256_17465 [Rhodococcus sp. 05-2254-6]
MPTNGKIAASVERIISRSASRKPSPTLKDPITTAINERFAQRRANNARLEAPKPEPDTRDHWDKVIDALTPKPEPEPVPALNSKQLLENAIAGASRATVNGTTAGTESVADLLRRAIENRQDFAG